MAKAWDDCELPLIVVRASALIFWQMGVLPRPIWKVLAQIPYAPWQQLVQSDARLADFVQPLVSAARQDLANGAAPQRQALSHRLSIAQDSHLGSLWSEEHVTSECIDHL